MSSSHAVYHVVVDPGGHRTSIRFCFVAFPLSRETEATTRTYLLVAAAMLLQLLCWLMMPVRFPGFGDHLYACTLYLLFIETTDQAQERSLWVWTDEH